MHKLAENAWQIKDTEEMMPMYKWERYLPEDVLECLDGLHTI